MTQDAEIQAGFDAMYANFRVHAEAITAVAASALFIVARIVRKYYPEAVYLQTQETDQDDSGALGFVDIIDAKMHSIDEDPPFLDDLWEPLNMLDSSNRSLWEAFADYKSSYFWVDLQAIIDRIELPATVMTPTRPEIVEGLRTMVKKLGSPDS